MEYRHTQTAIVIIAGTGLVFVFMLVVFVAPGTFQPVGAAVALMLLLVLYLFSSLTVEVRSGSVLCYFGPGLIRREIPLAEIIDAQPVTNPWLAGWGIRWLPGHSFMWNVSGLRAVELTLSSGRRFRIGTDEPEALARAIQVNKTVSPVTPL